MGCEFSSGCVEYFLSCFLFSFCHLLIVVVLLSGLVLWGSAVLSWGLSCLVLSYLVVVLSCLVVAMPCLVVVISCLVRAPFCGCVVVFWLSCGVLSCPEVI
jgi:hypothetical protein